MAGSTGAESGGDGDSGLADEGLAVLQPSGEVSASGVGRKVYIERGELEREIGDAIAVDVTHCDAHRFSTVEVEAGTIDIVDIEAGRTEQSNANDAKLTGSETRLRAAGRDLDADGAQGVETVMLAKPIEVGLTAVSRGSTWRDWPNGSAHW